MPTLKAQLGRGPLSMLLGFVLLGLVPVMVKSLGAIGWNAAHTVVARFAIACACIVVIVAARRRLLQANNKPLLLLRGVLGGAAVLLFFTSVQLAGAGVGTVLNYTYPVWANVFAALFLRQRPLPGFWLLLAIALGGVYLVVDPSWSALDLGELAGVASAMLAGAAVVCIKQLRETDDSLIIIWSFSAIGLLFALPIAIADTLTASAELPWGDARGWLLLGLTGLFSFLGHVYFTQGYKHTSLQLGSVLALSVPIVAVFCGWLLLDEALSPMFLLGGGLILAATGLLGALERRSVAKAARGKSSEAQ
jgi:drug/metabolite transporter (DMT)-like permease